MVAGESQDWSWAASGCVRSLSFVLASYRSTAALKIDWKLDREEVEGVFGTWDIELIAKQISRQEEDDREFASAYTHGRWRGASSCPGGRWRFWVHRFAPCDAAGVLRISPSATERTEPPALFSFDTTIIQGILATPT